MKHLFKVVLGLVLLTCAVAAQAISTCNALNGNDTVIAGTMDTPVNTAPGTTIKSVTNDFIVQCRDAANGVINFTNTIKLQPNGSLVSGYNDVYATNVSGLGVRYVITYPPCNITDEVITGSSGWSHTCGWTNVGGSYIPRTMTLKTEFVITGSSVPTGTLTSIPQLQLWYTASDSGGPWGQVPPLSGVATGSLSAATCTILQKDLTLTLDPINATDLASNGATAAPKSVDLNLTCPATNIKLALTLTDNVDPSNRTSILKPTADSTARGVSFQLLDNKNNLILMGPDSAVAGNTNQIVIGTTEGYPAIYIPLTARYIRTDIIRPGTLKSLVTYTLSYQ